MTDKLISRTPPHDKITAVLVLEDGSVFWGYGLGKEAATVGEVCFNTSMTGYQEILTDPSYRGQIVTMTYPQIGNYGVNEEDLESGRPHMAGFIVRENCRRASNFRSEGSLEDFLKEHNIVGLAGIDTRALVRRIRTQGAMKGVISTDDLDDASLVEKAKASPGLVGRDLVSEVLPDQPCHWDESLSPWDILGDDLTTTLGHRGTFGYRIILIHKIEDALACSQSALHQSHIITQLFEWLE